MVTTYMDMARDIKEAAFERTFFSLWSTPWAMAYGTPKQTQRHHLRTSRWEDTPEVKDALARVNEGGLAAAIVRLGLAHTRQKGRVDLVQVERVAQAFHTVAPFKTMSDEARLDLLNRQRLIVEFAPDQGLGALGHLIKTQVDRRKAEDVLRYIFQVERDDIPADVLAAWEAVVDQLNMATKTPSIAAE